MASLFPNNDRLDITNDWTNFVWSADFEVNIGEVHGVVRRVSSSPTKAPGPDGIRRVTLKKINDGFLEWLRYTYDLCLRLGEFPTAWKCANLVLIPKAGPPVDGALPKVRPICLINEIAKAFERIIAGRIYSWQADSPESDLSVNQYGFRKFRSTCDAVARLREITATASNSGEYAIVVGLDIQNAFNNIPWRVIRKALRVKNFPPYLRRIVDSYLSDRTVQYVDKNRMLCRRSVTAGVPQGSVLGPVLWNIAYDSVLSLADNEAHCNILCYADDTVVIVTGRDIEHTSLRAGVFITRVINYI